MRTTNAESISLIDHFDPQFLAALSGLDMKARYIVEGFLHGLHKSPFHGLSVEFSEYRDYQPGRRFAAFGLAVVCPVGSAVHQKVHAGNQRPCIRRDRHQRVDELPRSRRLGNEVGCGPCAGCRAHFDDAWSKRRGRHVFRSMMVMRARNSFNLRKSPANSV